MAEVHEVWQTNPAFPHTALKSERDAMDEILKPCGRFNSPLSWFTRARLDAARTRALSSPFGAEPLALVGGAPPNWQVLAHYLHEHGITDSEHFTFDRARADMPRRHSVRLAPRENTSDTDGRSVARHGFGSAASAEESMSRAVGEVLERYFLTAYRRADLREASFRQVNSGWTRVLDIFSLNDFLPRQKEAAPALIRSDEKPLTWVEGREAGSGAQALVPAQLVYWNYKFRNGEMVLLEPNTNGGAGHFSRDEAVLSGLLELIQRDGFLIFWLNAISPKRIDASTIVDGELKNFLLYLRRYRLDAHFLNTTTDIGVPSCACALIDWALPGGPLITVGGAAGFSLKELLMQSAGEALAVHNAISARPAFLLPEGYRPFTDRVVGRNERLALWRGEEMYERFRFFIEGPRQSFEGFMGEAQWHATPAKRLAYVLKRLRALGPGYEAYYCEVRHPLLATLGYHVVKTIVPRLVPLYLREHMAPLAAPRLREVPEQLGYAPATEYNPWPHPFP